MYTQTCRYTHTYACGAIVGPIPCQSKSKQVGQNLSLSAEPSRFMPIGGQRGESNFLCCTTPKTLFVWWLHEVAKNLMQFGRPLHAQIPHLKREFCPLATRLSAAKKREDHRKGREFCKRKVAVCRQNNSPCSCRERGTSRHPRKWLKPIPPPTAQRLPKHQGKAQGTLRRAHLEGFLLSSSFLFHFSCSSSPSPPQSSLVVVLFFAFGIPLLPTEMGIWGCLFLDVLVDVLVVIVAAVVLVVAVVALLSCLLLFLSVWQPCCWIHAVAWLLGCFCCGAPPVIWMFLVVPSDMFLFAFV